MSEYFPEPNFSGANDQIEIDLSLIMQQKEI